MNNNTISELNNLVAYENNTPITMPSQLKKSFGFTPDAKLPVFFWGGLSLDDAITHYSEYRNELPDIQTLGEKLIEFGGTRSCMPPTEEDITNIMQRGQLWYGDEEKFFEGDVSSCHANSATLYMITRKLEPEKFYIATGYALSDDGLWRQHSWCLHIQEDGKTCPVESTVGRLAYFGYVLTETESIAFAEYCLPDYTFKILKGDV